MTMLTYDVGEGFSLELETSVGNRGKGYKKGYYYVLLRYLGRLQWSWRFPNQNSAYNFMQTFLLSKYRNREYDFQHPSKLYGVRRKLKAKKTQDMRWETGIKRNKTYLSRYNLSTTQRAGYKKKSHLRNKTTLHKPARAKHRRYVNKYGVPLRGVKQSGILYHLGNGIYKVQKAILKTAV